MMGVMEDVLDKIQIYKQLMLLPVDKGSFFGLIIRYSIIRGLTPLVVRRWLATTSTVAHNNTDSLDHS